MLQRLPSYSDIDCQSSQKNVGIELRSRSAKVYATERFDHDSPTFGNGGSQFGNRIMIDHIVKPGETLNIIALQYSVQVSEIKRANGMVTDQEIFALPLIRIPVLPHHPYVASSSSSACQNNTTFLSSNSHGFDSSHNNYLQSEITTSNLMRFDNHSSSLYHRCSLVDAGKTPLLCNDLDEYSSESDTDFLALPNNKKKSKKAIKNLLEKTDAAVAAVRENLSEKSPTLEGGAFHFIDATAPDTNAKGFWLILFSVIFMFVIVPLVFTLMEEQNKTDAQHNHKKNFLTTNTYRDGSNHF